MTPRTSNSGALAGSAAPRAMAEHVRAAWQGWRSFREAAPATYVAASGQRWLGLTETDFYGVADDWVTSWQELLAAETNETPSLAELGRTLRRAEAPAERIVAYAAAARVVGKETARDRVLLANVAEQLGIQGLLRRHIDGASQRPRGDEVPGRVAA